MTKQNPYAKVVDLSRISKNMRSIDQKIVSFSVKSQDASASPSLETLTDPKTDPQKTDPQKTEMSETIKRPDVLVGSTYKIAKSPASEHALYITINDIVLDEGTPFERRRPFEIFINSKNMDQFQWIVAMTRILSAVFRKGGDVTFVVEEMKAVFDPHGGYYKKGGYVPSLIAEIGGIVEDHLKKLGMIDNTMDEATLNLIAEKKALFASTAPIKTSDKTDPLNSKENSGDATEADAPVYPPNATHCNKCHQKAVVILDGCATCLSCGASKCG